MNGGEIAAATVSDIPTSHPNPAEHGGDSSAAVGHMDTGAGVATPVNGGTALPLPETNGQVAGSGTTTDGVQSNGAAAHGPNGNGANGNGTNGNGERNGQCTAPQLRRFIKSRPYVPMHELRRRFGIDGADDDVTAVKLEPGWVYVGLPDREGILLGDLLRSGEIGYELSLDPRTPIVIGVYPMRPIPRS